MSEHIPFTAQDAAHYYSCCAFMIVEKENIPRIIAANLNRAFPAGKANPEHLAMIAERDVVIHDLKRTLDKVGAMSGYGHEVLHHLCSMAMNLEKIVADRDAEIADLSAVIKAEHQAADRAERKPRALTTDECFPLLDAWTCDETTQVKIRRLIAAYEALRPSLLEGTEDDDEPSRVPDGHSEACSRFNPRRPCENGCERCSV